MTFKVHTIESAPVQSKETLQNVKRMLGFIPNLAAAMSEAPALVQGFFALRDIFANKGTFTPVEQQTLYLANAYENRCEYCLGLHTAVALKEDAPRETIDALRAGSLPSNPRLRALSSLSQNLIRKRGDISEQDLASFYEAGFSPAQSLEVVLGIAVSTMANYAHHVVQCPLDNVFKAHEWKKPVGQ